VILGGACEGKTRGSTLNFSFFPGAMALGWANVASPMTAGPLVATASSAASTPSHLSAAASSTASTPASSPTLGFAAATSSSLYRPTMFAWDPG
jgi:hypothetical protein